MNWKFWESLSLPNLTAGSAKTITRVAGGIIVIYLAATLLLWGWWDHEPDEFSVVDHAALVARQNGVETVTGYTTTATLAHLAETLLEKRGGYLSNDMFPPGVWMDNVPEWEFGVLTQVRDMARHMRVDFSRSQSQSREDKDLSEAEGRFFMDSNSWIFPQAEDEYRRGIAFLYAYMERLADPESTGAQFYARADNLRNWLSNVETRMGSLSQRLSASVGRRQLNIDLAGERAATQATAAPSEAFIKTPWLDIDNAFYEARGQAWALLHLLRAIDHDFADVLDDKNARVSLQQIIRELEATQDTLWSPMILNGDGFTMWANHSLVMASYVSRANAALIDLRSLLAQG